MKAFKLAVWDEAGMAHCFNHSSVEYTLVDICESPTLYAGKVIVLSGDFRQLLPVVELGSSQDSVRACLKNYPRIWDKVRIMRLMRNMRLERLTGADADLQRAFSNWLLTVGNGTAPTFPRISPCAIQLPSPIVARSESIEDLINDIYGDRARLADPAFLIERVILTPLNVDVAAINSRVLQLFTGCEYNYFSADTLEAGMSHPDITSYPPEMLAMVDCASLPPACLHLKEGMPVILLRNLNGDQGQV